MMKISNIEFYSQQGKRSYQEDSFNYGENFILVSDGVGGLAKGDIASGIVKEIFTVSIAASPQAIGNIESWIKNVVKQTLTEMFSYVEKYPESHGMGATLAFVWMVDYKFYAIHIGDSRIYHIDRDGAIKWKSKDHSLVQELVDEGILTDAEAIGHPRKNVITRVLQAKEGANANASIHMLQNVEVGDHVMVCSDGVIESWTDENLSMLFKSSNDNQKIISELEKKCQLHSGDNNTAILGSVAGELKDNAQLDQDLNKIGVVSENTMQKTGRKNQDQRQKFTVSIFSEKNKKWIFASLVLIFILFILKGYPFQTRTSGEGSSNQNIKKDSVDVNENKIDVEVN